MTDKPDKPDDPEATGNEPAKKHEEGDDRWDDPLHRATGMISAVEVPDELLAELQKPAEPAKAADPAGDEAAKRAEEERLATERAAAARLEEERLAAERANAALAEAQRADAERAAAMQAEIERQKEKRAADQREADERAAEARAAAARAEKERLTAQRLEDKRAAEQRAADEQAEARRAAEKEASDARAARRAEEERMAAERAAEKKLIEQERIEREKSPAGGGSGPKGGGGLALGEAAAGAGALGLIGAAAIFVVAIVFFVAESFFLATLLISFALLVYVAGAELGKLLWSSLTVFFSSKHLIKNATYISDTVVALRKALYMRRDDAGNIKVGPIEPGTKIKLPDNPLVRELQAVLKRKKGKEYAEYVAHQYYVDCRELYDHFHAHLEFVANVMPLFGLIGTVIGLIGMFDRLGSNTSIENLSPQLAISLQCTLWGAIFASMYMTTASRFDQRIRALEYDFDILLHSFDVLVENHADVELQA